MAWSQKDNKLANEITSYDELAPELAKFLDWYQRNLHFHSMYETCEEIAGEYIFYKKDV